MSDSESLATSLTQFEKQSTNQSLVGWIKNRVVTLLNCYLATPVTHSHTGCCKSTHKNNKILNQQEQYESVFLLQKLSGVE